MNKAGLRLMQMPDDDGRTIQDKVHVKQIYKNGNYRIPGQRSISPGNWNRKRSMLIHHKEVRAYREYYGLENVPYLKSVKALKKARKKDDEFFKLGLRGS